MSSNLFTNPATPPFRYILYHLQNRGSSAQQSRDMPRDVYVEAGDDMNGTQQQVSGGGSKVSRIRSFLKLGKK